MSLTLLYPSRCGECGLRMSVGDPYISTATANGKWVISHTECPEPTPEARVAHVVFDVEQLYTVRRCSREPRSQWDAEAKRLRPAEAACGQVTAFKRGGRLTPTCPYCGSAWVRGNADEEAWAA